MATLLIMQTVGIKLLKNKLSEYVRAAAAGETVLVTDRGKVVAELVPPRAVAEATSADGPPITEAQRMWAELIRRGIVRPAKTPPEARLPPRRMPIMSLEKLMAEIEADREDR